MNVEGTCPDGNSQDPAAPGSSGHEHSKPIQGRLTGARPYEEDKRRQIIRISLKRVRARTARTQESEQRISHQTWLNRERVAEPNAGETNKRRPYPLSNCRKRSMKTRARAVRQMSLPTETSAMIAMRQRSAGSHQSFSNRKELKNEPSRSRNVKRRKLIAELTPWSVMFRKRKRGAAAKEVNLLGTGQGGRKRVICDEDSNSARTAGKIEIELPRPLTSEGDPESDLFRLIECSTTSTEDKASNQPQSTKLFAAMNEEIASGEHNRYQSAGTHEESERECPSMNSIIASRTSLQSSTPRTEQQCFSGNMRVQAIIEQEPLTAQARRLLSALVIKKQTTKMTLVPSPSAVTVVQAVPPVEIATLSEAQEETEIGSVEAHPIDLSTYPCTQPALEVRLHDLYHRVTVRGSESLAASTSRSEASPSMSRRASGPSPDVPGPSFITSAKNSRDRASRVISPARSAAGTSAPATTGPQAGGAPSFEAGVIFEKEKEKLVRLQGKLSRVFESKAHEIKAKYDEESWALHKKYTAMLEEKNRAFLQKQRQIRQNIQKVETNRQLAEALNRREELAAQVLVARGVTAVHFGQPLAPVQSDPYSQPALQQPGARPMTPMAPIYLSPMGGGVSASASFASALATWRTEAHFNGRAHMEGVTSTASAQPPPQNVIPSTSRNEQPRQFFPRSDQ